MGPLALYPGSPRKLGQQWCWKEGRKVRGQEGRRAGGKEERKKGGKEGRAEWLEPRFRWRVACGS